MIKRLYISDPDKLQITRITPWKVNFKYNGDSYELRGEYNDAGGWQTLYIRNSDGTKVAVGGTDLVGSQVERIYFPYRNKLHKEYKFIDKKDFVWKMTKFGVIDSPYIEKINSLKNEIQQYLIKIADVQDILRNLDVGSPDRHKLENTRYMLECEKNKLMRLYSGRRREDGVFIVKRTV